MTSRSFIEELENKALETTRKRIKPNSRRTYGYQVDSFRKWSVEHELGDPLREIDSNTPNYIRLYIVYKCETLGRGISTADSIRAALRNYYRVELQCADGWDGYMGNPCDDLHLKTCLEDLKKDKVFKWRANK